jgi:NAD(P)-dependent dehydrogenase (short-subunit alcohol dehydrogenase family)
MAKRVLVTGVTSGIGSAIKTLFESAGWEVVGLARHLPLDQEGFEVDLAKLEGVEPTALRASVEKGPFDAFIHVAGVWHDAEESFIGKRLHEFEWQQIAATMNVGLTSAMIISATLLETMPNAASMIFISGKFQDGGANWLPYYTSKRALEDFVVGLAADESHINVWGVSPDDTASEAYKRFYPDAAQHAQPPESVARTCLDLVDGRLSADSGTIVEVSGGKAGAGYHR